MHPTALSASKQSHAQRWVHNALGIAHHLAADWDEASSEFGIALELAEHLAQRGDAHDAYVDLVGVLIDSAANDICCDDMNGAETKLKRGAYMLKRAYRPSHVARASLLHVEGLLHSARAQHDEALSKYNSAFALLSRPALSSAFSAWTQAAMAATVSSLLVKGEHQAAARLADSAAASISTSEEHDVRTHCVAVANYAITQVECLRERARSGEQVDHGKVKAFEKELAHVSLRFAEHLGAEHPETQKAEANYSALKDGTLPPVTFTFQSHWLPAIGAGLTDKIALPEGD